MMYDPMMDCHGLRRWMKHNNIREFRVEDYGESTKFTVSYHDGKTRSELER